VPFPKCQRVFFGVSFVYPSFVPVLRDVLGSSLALVVVEQIRRCGVLVNERVYGTGRMKYF
jgi:hypothetical protein